MGRYSGKRNRDDLPRSYDFTESYQNNWLTNLRSHHQTPEEISERSETLSCRIDGKTGIPNAAKRYDEYPFQYSGGMRQRIVIAIALACRPKILICDEPTTALDVTIQAQILELIKELQEEYQFTTIFITHDLGVVAAIADKVAVMYAGQIIESGTVEEIFMIQNIPIHGACFLLYHN